MDTVRVYVGSDHAGFSLRKNMTERLRGQGREVVDLGPETDATCDYPEFASAVANAVRSDPGALGILVCATGQGMAIAAGKVRGIRAVVPATVEAARLTRFDNDANVLCIGARLLAERDAFAIVDTWLATAFAGGRHARRIAKVAAIETASAVVFVTESERLRLASLGLPGRIFAQDATLFSEHPAAQARIKDGLGWVAQPTAMRSRAKALTTFAREVRRSPLKDLILLVDDGRQAPAAAMARACAATGLRLHVLGAARTAAGEAGADALPDRLQLGTTFVLLVDEPSGSDALATVAQNLGARFAAKLGSGSERGGQRFAAVTTPDSRVATLGREQGYRQVFLAPSDGLGLYGLLGYEGMAPAALLGQDTAKLLDRALAMAQTCRTERLEENPGASLGVLLGAMAKHGRDRLTLLLSRSLAPLGTWIAQVVDSATRQGRHAITVVHGEPLLPHYPPNRVFVHVQVDGDPPAAAPEQMEALHGAGHPYIHLAVADRLEIAAEIFRWQMAATVAALVTGSTPLPLALTAPAAPRAAGV